MPRDFGANAPPLPFVLHLDRLALQQGRDRREARRRRRATRQRLGVVEYLLARLIQGADLIGRDKGIGRYHLLVSIDRRTFDGLCVVGAQLEDLEDSHDAEPGEDKEPDADDEPSLGTPEMLDQRNWALGNSADLEEDVRLVLDEARRRYRAHHGLGDGDLIAYHRADGSPVTFRDLTAEVAKTGRP